MTAAQLEPGGPAGHRATHHRRQDPRVRLCGSAYLVLPDRSIRVRILNLSFGGALLHCPEEVRTRFEGRLVADYIDRRIAATWMGHRSLGVRFADRLTPAELREVQSGAGRERRAVFGRRERH